MTETVRIPYRAPVVEPDLLAKYGLCSSRSISYPSEVRLADVFRPIDAVRELGRRAERGGPVSLCFHLPLCASPGNARACDEGGARDPGRGAEYLGYLEREIATQRGALGQDEQVAQLYWGRSTPANLSTDEMTRLMQAVRRYFVLLPDGEYSIEIDPGCVTARTIEHMAGLGFNRLSLGVQDFDREVQAKADGIQSAQETRQLLDAARLSGFRSVSVDLVYGLPAQSVQSMERTLVHVLEMRPERVSLYNYAHLHRPLIAQRPASEAQLPVLEEKIGILALGIERLTGAGYVHIGMEHFALPEDGLAQAQALGSLHLDFQGYSSGSRCDVLSFGVAAIGAVGETCFQNRLTLEEYYASLERGELPVFRGRRLSADDIVRREAMLELACRFRLAYGEFGERMGINAAKYFAAECRRLGELERDGLIEFSHETIVVTARGRLLVGAVCMAFDRSSHETRGGVS